ncbi:phenazine antibiotic biosynthesis protein, partial [Streptomyces sp. WAC 05379]
MSDHGRTDPVLDCPADETPDGEELITAAMRWHFSPETGSPFWLERAGKLDFDPLRDVKSFADLRLFPNLVNELRDVRVEELIPRGLTLPDDLYGIYE